MRSLLVGVTSRERLDLNRRNRRYWFTKAADKLNDLIELFFVWEHASQSLRVDAGEWCLKQLPQTQRSVLA